MKTCPNCNYKNDDANNFCKNCGTKLETPPVRCPKCETELTNQSKFCHNCGTKLTEDSKETSSRSPFGFFGRLQKTSSNDDKDYDDDYDNDEENDDDNNDIDWDNYEMKSEDELRAMFGGDNEDDEDDEDYCDDYDEDDEIDWDNYEMKSADELRAMSNGDYNDDDNGELSNFFNKKISKMEKMQKGFESIINKTNILQIKLIIRQYLPQISKDHVHYDFTDTEKYPQVFQNVMKNIAKDVNEEEILGFIDVTVFGKGKAGLVFTTEALYEKGPMFSSKVPYYRMTSISCNGKEITIHKTEDCGTGLVSQMNISYNHISYDIPALENCLNEIIAIVNE